MQAEASILLDTYELTLSPITFDDVPRLHELSIGVNWPHRPHDWELLLSVGHGFAARDEIGRIVGSAMWFPMGPGRATIGMVITSPRLQENGAGRWLMKHVLAQTKGREKVLNATKPAYRLYLSLGFAPLKTVFQHNGVAHHVPDGPDHARPMTEDDRAAICRLDSLAQAADRSHIFDLLFPVSQGTVIDRNGTIEGFALCREFGRGRVIGPVVAASEEDAIALIRPHVIAHKDSFLRMDTREAGGRLSSFLNDAGIALYDTVTTMTLDCGDPQTMFSSSPYTVYGLVNQALG
ncbi:GNAT family N-acetyltransferase [Roseibium litorale]|uniref:GNAT family N-acetyltransferase n=1 Tax=Roseibium litorale TaxID=2803841 RepID=A0ABR9CJF4_9HYPH|nr:GNAT family N-acetyltransferase [Roseibium litorale]MBD8890974.1 GNAT family N-acetyltransferase [Roseibium litorale]